MSASLMPSKGRRATKERVVSWCCMCTMTRVVGIDRLCSAPTAPTPGLALIGSGERRTHEARAGVPGRPPGTLP